MLAEKKEQGYAKSIVPDRPLSLIENKAFGLPPANQPSASASHSARNPKTPFISRLRRRIGR